VLCSERNFSLDCEHFKEATRLEDVIVDEIRKTSCVMFTNKKPTEHNESFAEAIRRDTLYEAVNALKREGFRDHAVEAVERLF
jgi:hypothetical protein